MLLLIIVRKPSHLFSVYEKSLRKKPNEYGSVLLIKFFLYIILKN